MNRGVVYFVWGDYDRSLIGRSIQSVKSQYDYEVITDKSSLRHFQKRANLFNSSPFDTTLYLDVDTIVKGNLDYGFEMAEKHKIACCIAPASSSYNAGAVEPIKNEIPVDLPQYNCGVLFCSKQAKPTFDIFSQLLRTHPESYANDQPYFSWAVYQTLNPYILPKTWNFRPQIRYESKRWHGELKIIHSRFGI